MFAVARPPRARLLRICSGRSLIYVAAIKYNTHKIVSKHKIYAARTASEWSWLRVKRAYEHRYDDLVCVLFVRARARARETWPRLIKWKMCRHTRAVIRARIYGEQASRSEYEIRKQHEAKNPSTMQPNVNRKLFRINDRNARQKIWNSLPTNAE